ncbi:MAG: PP2C family protein-serine/threonine phosphatase [Spirochaetia bacterium]|nr:serine/threonine-protein phosphatase [Spirochaetota bacterium]MCX8096748.1 serine/threonine-protein phosphatase [Spirochaetota bacterium]MDW8112146.1 PP2C family protein-serine/threonine phosphatase [Spirochaetia bacterium]
MKYSIFIKYISQGVSILLLFSVFYIAFIYTKSLENISFIIINGLLISLMYYVFNPLSERLSRLLLDLIIYNKWNKPINKFIQQLETTISDSEFVNLIKRFIEVEANIFLLWIENNKVIYKSPSRLFEDENIMKNLTSLIKEEGVNKYTEREIINGGSNEIVAILLKHNQFELFFISRYISIINPSLFEEMYSEIIKFTKRREIIENMFKVSTLSHEWELLSKIQKVFLPETIPPIKGLDVSISFEPLVSVSGDYYHIIPLQDEKYLFVIGDVSGKGLNASLLMAVIVNAIKINRNKTLKEIIYEVDRTIKDLEFEGKYTTIILLLCNPENGEIEFVNSAMPRILLVRDGNIQEFQVDLPPLGIIDLPEFQTSRYKLKEGDLLFLTSDGILEAKNNYDEEYQNTGRLKNLLISNYTKKSEEVSRIIREDLKDFLSSSKLSDDLTYIIIKKGGVA